MRLRLVWRGCANGGPLWSLHRFLADIFGDGFEDPGLRLATKVQSPFPSSCRFN
jgi:hypothetical protein